MGSRIMLRLVEGGLVLERLVRLLLLLRLRLRSGGRGGFLPRSGANDDGQKGQEKVCLKRFHIYMCSSQFSCSRLTTVPRMIDKQVQSNVQC